MALAPGSRLGPYEVTAKIGQGGMGEVYKQRSRKKGLESGAPVPTRAELTGIGRWKIRRLGEKIGRSRMAWKFSIGSVLNCDSGGSAGKVVGTAVDPFAAASVLGPNMNSRYINQESAPHTTRRSGGSQTLDLWRLINSSPGADSRRCRSES